MANVSLDESLLKDAVTIIRHSVSDQFAMGDVVQVVTLLEAVLTAQGTKPEAAAPVVTPEVVEDSSSSGADAQAVQ